MKCYDKYIQYRVPELKCSMCKKTISVGEELCMVILTWGYGKSTCRDCYDKYEIDWSMRFSNDDEDDEDF